MSKAISVAITAIFAALILASLLLLPFTTALAAVLVLCVLFVLVDAMRNRILFKMAVRNVIRRPGTTALVLAGLMVGTAIISATLVVGDTFDNMVVGEVTQGYGEIDFGVTGQGQSMDGYYDLSSVTSVRQAVLDLDHVSSAEWYISTSSTILNRGSNLSLPSVSVFGITPAVVSSLGGFVSPGGEAVNVPPSANMVYVNEDLANSIDISAGDVIVLFHDGKSLELTVQTVVASEALGGVNIAKSVFLDLGLAQDLRDKQDKVNVLSVSLDDVGRDNAAAVRAELDELLLRPEFQPLDLEVTADRAEHMKQGRETVSMLTSMVFVFGSFSIIAGVVLIVNIFTMLGEERKGEMGMARAVGMQRHHLRKLFVFEGMLYALATAAIGTLVGLALAYVLIAAVSMVVDMGGVAIADYFAFMPSSMLLAYLAGFLLTMASIYGVTRRISNMNIVRAIRNIPEPLRSRDDRKSFMLGLLAVAAGALIMVMGMMAESQGPALGGLSVITLSMGLLLRRVISDRIAWTVSGLLTLFIWFPKGFDIFPYPGNLEMFVLAGVFNVTAALIIVMFNSDPIVGFFNRVLRVKGGYKAVVKTSLSYPLRAKGRTAMSMFIFALVIFTVTTLSMMSGMLGIGIPKMIEETSGGFDIIAFSNAPFDMDAELSATSGLVNRSTITDLVALNRGFAQFTVGPNHGLGETEPRQFFYSIIGVKPELYTVGNYPLLDWNRTLYPTEADVWKAVEENPGVAVLDGSAAGSDPAGMGMIVQGPLRGIALGDNISMTGMTGSENVTVIGFTEQSVFSGVFVRPETVLSVSGINASNLFMINVADGVDAEKHAILLQNQFVNHGLSTVPMRALAEDAVSQIIGVFDLLKAFLAMGLVIGITGLGIITIRSIHERRIEIGMMRAIGYTRRMIVTNFALESAFVAVLGILIGSFLGIITGYDLWLNGFRDMGMDFLIPWTSILLVGIASFAACLLTVLPAARGASRVAPAEVLRFE